MGVNAIMEKEFASFSIIREGQKRAYHHVFIAHSDDKVMPDKSEVAEIREISLVNLKKEIEKNPEQFFDGFLAAIKKYLATYKD